MNLFEKLRIFFVSGIKEVPAPFNGTGSPPHDLTWKTASSKYFLRGCMYHWWGRTVYVVPKSCPVCKCPLIEEKHDWMDIEQSGQYMVYSYTCPRGHGHYVEWA